jgi:hypothetical protein
MIGPDQASRTVLRGELEGVIGWREGSEEKAQLLLEILGSMSDATFPGAVIPRVRDGRLLFYAVADSSLVWRRLQPLLRAYSGVTLSDFDGRTTTLDPADGLERVLLEHGLTFVARFQASSVQYSRALVDSLVRLKRSLDRAPNLEDRAPRTTAQLIGDFRLASAREDRPAAVAILKDLREQMRLDALNLCFLEVQLYASLKDWQGLLEREFVASICQTRRPPRVTAALAEAVYSRYLQPHLADGPVPLLDRFRTDVVAQYGGLFTTCPPAPSTPVAITFLLAALASSTVETGFIDRLLADSESRSEEERDALLTLAHFARSTLKGRQVVAARVTFDPMGQIDSLRNMPQPASVSDVRAGLFAASIVQTLDAFEVVYSCGQALSSQEREDLLSSDVLRAMWSDLEAHVSTNHVPQNWIDLIRDSQGLDFSVLRQWAEKAVTEFPIDRQIADSTALAELVRALQAAFAASEPSTTSLLPFLVEWTRADPRWPNSDYRSLYLELLDLLMMSSDRSPSVVGAVVDLASGVLSLGVGAVQYGQTVADLGDWLRTASGPYTTDNVLDLTELVVTQPCPDAPSRRRFWSAAAAELARLWSRLSPAQRSMACDLAESLADSDWAATMQATAIATSTVRATPFTPPRGYTVTIYTLMAAAGDRIRRALLAEYPELKVELSTDSVSTPQLEDLARSSDLFVVCWAAAKHAATEAIKRRRPQSRKTLYPRGVGSSSVVQEILAELARG